MYICENVCFRCVCIFFVCVRIEVWMFISCLYVCVFFCVYVWKLGCVCTNAYVFFVFVPVCVCFFSCVRMSMCVFSCVHCGGDQSVRGHREITSAPIESEEVVCCRSRDRRCCGGPRVNTSGERSLIPARPWSHLGHAHQFRGRPLSSCPLVPGL